MGEMILVADGTPTQDVFDQLRHRRKLLDQHDDFVEKVQVVVGEAGSRIDDGFSRSGSCRARRLQRISSMLTL